MVRLSIPAHDSFVPVDVRKTVYFLFGQDNFHGDSSVIRDRFCHLRSRPEFHCLHCWPRHCRCRSRGDFLRRCKFRTTLSPMRNWFTGFPFFNQKRKKKLRPFLVLIIHYRSSSLFTPSRCTSAHYTKASSVLFLAWRQSSDLSSVVLLHPTCHGVGVSTLIYLSEESRSRSLLSHSPFLIETRLSYLLRPSLHSLMRLARLC